MSSRKRGLSDGEIAHHAAKRQRADELPRPFELRISHGTHPASGCGQNFHDVAYPNSLLPFNSWHALHENEDWEGVCAKCRKSRPFSGHDRKLFLVAERLSWADRPVPRQDRELNEINLWSVNADLGIVEPAIEDSAIVPGGHHSRTNCWHPYASEADAMAAMSLVKTAESLTDTSYSLWARLHIVRKPLLPPPRPPSSPVFTSRVGTTTLTAEQEVSRFGHSTVSCVEKRLVQLRMVIATRAHRTLADSEKCMGAVLDSYRSPSVPAAENVAVGLPSGPAIKMIADRAASDLALKKTMLAVSRGGATREQLQAFHKHVTELRAIYEANEATARHHAAIERKTSLVKNAEADLMRMSSTIAELERLAGRKVGRPLLNGCADYRPMRGSMLLKLIGIDRAHSQRDATALYDQVFDQSIELPHCGSLHDMAETATKSLLKGTNAPELHDGDTIWTQLEVYVMSLLEKAAENDKVLEMPLGQFRTDTFSLPPEGKARLRDAADYCAEHCEELDPLVPDVDVTGLLTPESSAADGDASHAALGTAICTLVEFYSQLDKLERLSPMATAYLEAYATRLRDDLCRDCWSEHNVLSDEQLTSEGTLDAHPDWGLRWICYRRELLCAQRNSEYYGPGVVGRNSQAFTTIPER
ncbi:hypothetical protein LTR95_008357 [Oleoguttula sp. CCFEE 5521]